MRAPKRPGSRAPEDSCFGTEPWDAERREQTKQKRKTRHLMIGSREFRATILHEVGAKGSGGIDAWGCGGVVAWLEQVTVTGEKKRLTLRTSRRRPYSRELRCLRGHLCPHLSALHCAVHVPFSSARVGMFLETCVRSE